MTMAPVDDAGRKKTKHRRCKLIAFGLFSCSSVARVVKHRLTVPVAITNQAIGLGVVGFTSCQVT